MNFNFYVLIALSSGKTKYYEMNGGYVVHTASCSIRTARSFPVVKRPERNNPPTAKVKNEMSCTTIPLYVFVL